MLFIIILFTLLSFFSCTKSPYGKDNTEPIQSKIVLYEIVSQNTSIIADEYGDFGDFIRIKNSGQDTVNLYGYGLSDNINYIKYTFPVTLFPFPDSVITLWCDGETEKGNLHADFRISSEGEWIGLYSPLSAIIDSVSLPALSPNQSYIRDDSLLLWSIRSY
jgi:hypothetical protein